MTYKFVQVVKIRTSLGTYNLDYAYGVWELKSPLGVLLSRRSDVELFGTALLEQLIKDGARNENIYEVAADGYDVPRRLAEITEFLKSNGWMLG